MVMLYEDDYVVEYNEEFYRLRGVDGAFWILSKNDYDEVRVLAIQCEIYKRMEFSYESI